MGFPLVRAYAVGMNASEIAARLAAADPDGSNIVSIAIFGSVVGLIILVSLLSVLLDVVRGPQ